MDSPGHFAIALAAKPVAPNAPLWLILAATGVLDLLAFGFMAKGIEHGGFNFYTTGDQLWIHINKL